MTISERFVAFRLTPVRACLVLLVVAAIFVAKQPDAFSRPQFWAEDGAVWYQDAHSLGPWVPFLKTQDGYFSTYLRAVAAVGSTLPLTQAPLFYNGVALAVMLLPAGYLLSARGRGMASDPVRALLALLYALAPNTAETHLNATNSQWHLALAAFLALVALPAASRREKVIDIKVLLLSGLSGPYAVFLAPLALVRWLRDKTRWNAVLLGVVSACAAVQALALVMFSGGGRVRVLPEASIDMLGAILIRQVFVGGTAGVGAYDALAGLAPAGAIITFLAGFAGIGLIIFAASRGSNALRAFLYFAGVSLAASLLYPHFGAPNAWPEYRSMAWIWLFESSSGPRYWLLPILAFITVIVFSLSPRHPRSIRVLGAMFLTLLACGAVRTFADPVRSDRHFPAQAAMFQALPKGETQTFTLDPEGWTMTLLAK